MRTPANPDVGPDIEHFADIFARLAAPFVHVKKRKGRGGKEFDYIDSTMVMNRLDDAVGPGRWNDNYQVIDSCVYCQITIFLPDGSHVTRGDASGYDIRKEGENRDRMNSDVIKTAFSDSFKRAALKFGVGRYIKTYGRMPSYYAKVSERLKRERALAASQPAASPAVQPEVAPANPNPDPPYALDSRPAPSKPPEPEEFPARRGPIVKPGAILYRILTNPPYIDDERSQINNANWFATENHYPARIVEWRIEQVAAFWDTYIKDPFPESLKRLLPFAVKSEK